MLQDVVVDIIYVIGITIICLINLF